MPYGRVARPIAAALSLAVGVTVVAVARAAAPAGEPSLVATIGMPDVRGRIDHLAIDRAGGRLFVAALGNDTLEVLDLRTGALQRSIAGLPPEYRRVEPPDFDGDMKDLPRIAKLRRSACRGG